MTDGPLVKEIYHNPLINSAVSTTISEYDIKGAHLVAIKILKGDSLYEKLANLPKLERNIIIGKMQIEDKELSNELKNLLFEFKKEFIVGNSIRETNIIESTKDSIVLVEKLPLKTKFTIKGTIVEWINKEGLFSSFYRIGNKSLYFDNMTHNIKIKGINNNTVDSSIFIKKALIPLLITLESSISLGLVECIKNMKTHRLNYIDSMDIDIYRSLDNKNKFLYEMENEIIESEILIKDHFPLKMPNYYNYFCPIMTTVI